MKQKKAKGAKKPVKAAKPRMVTYKHYRIRVEEVEREMRRWCSRAFDRESEYFAAASEAANGKRELMWQEGVLDSHRRAATYWRQRCLQMEAAMWAEKNREWHLPAVLTIGDEVKIYWPE